MSLLLGVKRVFDSKFYLLIPQLRVIDELIVYLVVTHQALEINEFILHIAMIRLKLFNQGLFNAYKITTLARICSCKVILKVEP